MINELKLFLEQMNQQPGLQIKIDIGIEKYSNILHKTHCWSALNAPSSLSIPSYARISL